MWISVSLFVLLPCRILFHIFTLILKNILDINKDLIKDKQSSNCLEMLLMEYRIARGLDDIRLMAGWLIEAIYKPVSPGFSAKSSWIHLETQLCLDLPDGSEPVSPSSVAIYGRSVLHPEGSRVLLSICTWMDREVHGPCWKPHIEVNREQPK